jgi:opacity protein-like surface antigen
VGDARFGNPGRNGYEVSVTAFPIRWLGVEAAFTDHFGDEDVPPGVLFPAGNPVSSYSIRTRVTSFMAGPKFALRGKRFTPYAHVLLGGVRQNTTLDVQGFDPAVQLDNTFGYAAGGGVTVRLNDRVMLRLGQVDYVHFSVDERPGELIRSSESANHIRASVGVAFTF